MIQPIKENWYKILAIALLLIAIGDHPYSYYQFLRWAILIIAGYSAYLAYNNRKVGWAWIFGVIAFLFNPIFPFYLEKTTWQFIDGITAVIFAISMFAKSNKP